MSVDDREQILDEDIDEGTIDFMHAYLPGYAYRFARETLCEPWDHYSAAIENIDHLGLIANEPQP